jgi:hypothetical protein
MDAMHQGWLACLRSKEPGRWGRSRGGVAPCGPPGHNNSWSGMCEGGRELKPAGCSGEPLRAGLARAGVAARVDDTMAPLDKIGI